MYLLVYLWTGLNCKLRSVLLDGTAWNVESIGWIARQAELVQVGAHRRDARAQAWSSDTCMQSLLSVTCRKYTCGPM
jgi:hypothetical protein